MNRIIVIQELIDALQAKTYLEIGVKTGECFLKIKAARKIGVDIKFLIAGRRRMITNYFANFGFNIFNRYYQMKSDEFFHQHCGLFRDKKIDLAFIDGFHEYKQVIRDIDNCINNLSEKGVLVLHDCNPCSEKIATPFDKMGEDFQGKAWSGDVWKAIVYARSCRPDLRVSVLNIDCGLGIIMRGKPDSLLNYSIADIANLSYHDLYNNRESMLNLKEPSYFEKFIKEIKVT